MRQKYYIDPFAVSGDQTAVPDATDPSGFVSYTQGYTFDYERLLDGSDPLAKFPTRQNMNYLLYELHLNTQQYQQNGLPEFITTANNGGTPFTYSKGAQVLYSVSGNPPFEAYISLVDGNADTPPSAKWLALIPYLIAPRRIKLAANTNFYVADTGNDSNNGLTLLTPWLTPSHAINVINSIYDFAGWNVTLNVFGNFSLPFVFTGVQVGQVGSLLIDGQGTAIITISSGQCVAAINGAAITIQNITVSETSGAGPLDSAIYAGPSGNVTVAGGVTLAAVAGTGFLANGAGAQLQITASVNVTGNQGVLASAASNAVLGVSSGININNSAALTFGITLVTAGCGVANWPSTVTFANATTGQKFSASTNGVIATNGSNPLTYFPGSTPGTQTSGGQYT